MRLLCACVCVHTCADTQFRLCQRSGNHCTRLLSCFFSSFPFKHKREQIILHKHVLALTESVFQIKANLSSLSLCNYMQTHTLTSNQNVLERSHFMQNRESGWSCRSDGFSCCLWPGVRETSPNQQVKGQQT